VIALRRERHDAPRGARIGAQPVYAIGDVHGCYDLLQALLSEIRRDAASLAPDAPPRVVMCGDYVDRGPDTAKVLAALTWLERSSAIDVTLLEGNHEAMFRGFLERPADHGRWVTFGGRQTLLSYGVTVPDACDDAAVLTRLRDALLDVMPVAHYWLLFRLCMMLEIGDYAFVHAGVRPGVPLSAQSRDDLLWIRGEFLDHPQPSTAVIVHGHTWADDRATVTAGRIGIDTGAYDTGVLTALRIADDGVEVIQAVAG
jgi:serine/threonine protein phosphatase 1